MALRCFTKYLGFQFNHMMIWPWGSLIETDQTRGYLQTAEEAHENEQHPKSTTCRQNLDPGDDEEGPHKVQATYGGRHGN